MRSLTRFTLAGCLLMTSPNSPFAQSLGLPVGISSNSNTMVSRSPDSRAWTDPALNHNKLIQQQLSDGAYKLVGPFKVKGDPFLFGEHHKADMFAIEAKAFNIYISYNTYNQEVEFYSTSNPDKPLVKEPGTVDSFIIKEDIDLGITHPLKFVYGPLLGAKDNFYYEEVCKGERFSLYKRYKSDLGYDGNNLGQSELRQFDLQYEYYYTDTETKGVKKIKPNASSVIKEFKSIKDLSSETNNDDFTVNPEEAFCKAFSSVNNVKKGF